jgi:hypothetical protein
MPVTFVKSEFLDGPVSARGQALGGMPGRLWLEFSALHGPADCHTKTHAIGRIEVTHAGGRNSP